MKEDIFLASRQEARREAEQLLWDKIENSIWWNQFQKFSEEELPLEKIRVQHQYFYQALMSFNSSFVPTVLAIEDKGIRNVLQFGAGRRLLSIRSAAKVFHEVAYPDRTEVASLEDLTRLDDALLIIYISVPAFFDALAVASHRSVRPKRYIEKNADVFSKKYLKSIGLEEVYDEIQPYLEWQKKLKEQLRHRYAHRIPPYVPSAQLNAEQVESYKTLQVEHGRAIEESRLEDALAIREQQSLIGSFCPWIGFVEDNFRMPLLSTVLNDLMTFQYVALSVFERLILMPGFLKPINADD